MGIPDFQGDYLPPGIDEANLDDVRRALSYNTYRRKLIGGLETALDNLRNAGVTQVYIDGSFVSVKLFPKDVDGCWDATPHINVDLLDPVFQDFSNERKAMKDKYGVDFFVSQWIEGGSGVPFVEFFQSDRNGHPKGILSIRL